MNTHIILVTHDKIGKALLHAASLIFGKLPLASTDVAISPDCDTAVIATQIAKLMQSLQHNNIIILTDIIGATPCNIVRQLPLNDRSRIIAGVNLPMLLKIMNYADLPLDELANKALEGGKQGICFYEDGKLC